MVRNGRLEEATNKPDGADEDGPSFKALHFLQPEDEGTFRCSEEVEDAVMSIDGIVSLCIPSRVLAPKPPAVTPQEAEPLATALRLDTPTEPERKAFRFLFYDA